MANVNNPYGLKPLMRGRAGGCPVLEPYAKDAAYAYAIYRFDPVTELAGYIQGPANGITPGTTRYRGVSMDFSLASTGQGGPSANPAMLVMDSSDAVFESQEDNSGGSNVVQAKLGYNANLTTTAGDATLKQSKVQISGTSINTTSSLDVRILALVGDPTNAFGAYARLEILFNKHQMSKEQTAT